jgi:hypothetical protein
MKAVFQCGEVVQQRAKQPRLPRPALQHLAFAELGNHLLRRRAADAVAAHQFADADAAAQAPGHAVAQGRRGQGFFLGLRQRGAQRLVGKRQQAVALAGFVAQQPFFLQ